MSDELREPYSIALALLTLPLAIGLLYGWAKFSESLVERVKWWWAVKQGGIKAHVATPIAVALIASAAALAAVVTSTYLVMHYSPYQTCVRNLMAEMGQGKATRFCSVYLGRASATGNWNKK